MDIRSHLGVDLISKGNVALLENGMHPPNVDAMGTFQVAHSRILARANHPDHGLIVVIEDEVGVVTPQLLPKCNGRQPQTSHSNNLGLRCGVTQAPLPFAKPRQWKACVRTLNVHVSTRGRFQAFTAASIVRIRKQPDG